MVPQGRVAGQKILGTRYSYQTTDPVTPCKTDTPPAFVAMFDKMHDQAGRSWVAEHAEFVLRTITEGHSPTPERLMLVKHFL